MAENKMTVTVTVTEAEAALHYAQRIAVAIYDKHWKEEPAAFKPFDDIMGVLSQIDNMVAGMKRYAEPCAGRCGEPNCGLDVEGAPLP